MANKEPKPLAKISNESKCVLAPHIGLNSSIVNITNINKELRQTIRRLYFNSLITTAFTKARLIIYAAMKFGKLPVKTFIIGILEYKGLKNSLFKETNPNKRANNNKLITIILCLLFRFILPFI